MHTKNSTAAQTKTGGEFGKNARKQRNRRTFFEIKNTTANSKKIKK